jgi:uncharacterized protein
MPDMNPRPEKIIDFHVHVFPDNLAPRAISTFVNAYKLQPLSDGTVADTSGHMAQARVDIYVPMPVATKPSQVRGINDWASSVRSETVIPFGSMHPDFDDIKGEIDRLVGMGFRGIKLQPDWQEFFPDEERAWPIYEHAEGRLAITFHAGREIEDMEVIRSTPDRLARIHEKFPHLTMIVAHLGGYRQWARAESELYGSGVYFDTSYCPDDELPDEEFLRMIRKHGANKILFASDFPFADPKRDIDRLLRLPLTHDEREDIAWRNGAKILGVPVFICPVCGYDLGFEPWHGESASDEICPCCGIQFGYNDATGGNPEARDQIYSRWRQRWTERTGTQRGTWDE